MKEATGELNATLIVVIMVAALAALFFTAIWPMIKDDLKNNSNCSNAICDPGLLGDSTSVECFYKDRNGKKQYISCPYTG